MALTPKEELFAKKRALENCTQVVAYSAAYDVSKMSPKAVADKAYQVEHRPEVKERIEVLRQGATAAAVKAAAYTIDAAISDAEADRELARSLGQSSAAVSATKLKAQLAGHLVEKKADAKGSLDDMDIEKLLALREAVEDKVERSREALAMTGSAPVEAPPQLRRVIG